MSKYLKVLLEGWGVTQDSVEETIKYLDSISNNWRSEYHYICQVPLSTNNRKAIVDKRINDLANKLNCEGEKLTLAYFFDNIKTRENLK